MDETIDGLESEFHPTVRAQTGVAVKQSLNESRPSLKAKSYSSHDTQYNARCGRTGERSPITRNQKSQRDEYAVLWFAAHQARNIPDSRGRRSKNTSDSPIKPAMTNPACSCWIFFSAAAEVSATISVARRDMIA